MAPADLREEWPSKAYNHLMTLSQEPLVNGEWVKPVLGNKELDRSSLRFGWGLIECVEILPISPRYWMWLEEQVLLLNKEDSLRVTQQFQSVPSFISVATGRYRGSCGHMAKRNNVGRKHKQNHGIISSISECV